MKPKKQFRPQNLRTLLAFLLVVLVVGGGAGFYWGIGLVREYAVQVEQRLADADASAEQLRGLQTLKNQLTQSDSLVEKANQLFATPASYQQQTLSDVKKYGDAAGLTIANTSFGDPAADGAHTMTLTLREPVAYSKLIAFLNNIESNLPKLQVSSISLGRVDNGNADSVKTGDIKINISVR